ncbi:MAG: NFACT family protein [Deinococcota bacterium]
MEGLLLAQALEPLTSPCERQRWRFPDAYTFVLPLLPVSTGKQALWLYNKPPNAQLTVNDNYPPVSSAQTGFQDLLASRVMGRLERITQHKLDRVVSFHFAGETGFVTTEPCVLIAELTGRNCNIIVTDVDGMILGAARDIGADINRYRQVRAGLPYLPPPEYDKLDPREVSTGELTNALRGRKLKALREVVDGFGPELTKTVAVLTGVTTGTVLVDELLEASVIAIQNVAANPQKSMQEALKRPDLATLRKQEARQTTLDSLKMALEKRLELLQKRLEDVDNAVRAATDADALRSQADVLMAYQWQVPKAARQVELTDFAGEPLEIILDPKLDAVSNAQKFYERAKKRDQRASQADLRRPELGQQRADIQTVLERVDNVSDAELGSLYKDYVKQPKQQYRATPGMRFESPQGYIVLVGRNAKDNDALTFRVARSLDVWLHVQGYQGSHVVVQASGKDVPFETIVYAASLAAGYSKAKESDNVAVDYSLKKHVWKVKGAPPGAVNFTQHKTVYVTPQRH